MTRLARTLGTLDGLAVVVGIMVGSGIFRTPGLVAGLLGRPALTLVAWVLGGAVGFLGALVFAELATRHPDAGGKYVYAREAYGRRAGFVIGWIESLAYCAAIAAIAVVSGEYLARLLSWPASYAGPLGVLLLVLLTGLNLRGVAAGRFVQNLTTGAKVVALACVVVSAGLLGSGAGWSDASAGGANGVVTWGGMAVAFQAVIFSYYGYPDAAKIAEEVKDPGRSLPRILLGGIALSTVLYLLLNAAFLQVLPFSQIVGSTLVPGDVVAAIFGAGAGAAVSALALVVVLGSLNGNVFVTPRVPFGLSRDGLGPASLARVNAGGTPAPAMILVAAVAFALATTGTFELLLSLAMTFVLLTDGFMVFVLFRLRARVPDAPFRVPGYPAVPLLFLAVYAAMFVGALWQQPRVSGATLLALLAAYALSFTVTRFR